MDLDVAAHRDPLDELVLEDAALVAGGAVEVGDEALVVLLVALEDLDEHEERQVDHSDGVVQLRRLAHTATHLCTWETSINEVRICARHLRSFLVRI